MKIPTLGSPQIWPKLAPRLAKYIKPKLGKAVRPIPFGDTAFAKDLERAIEKLGETNASLETRPCRNPHNSI